MTISFENMEGSESIVGTLEGNTLKLSFEFDSLEVTNEIDFICKNRVAPF